MSFTSILVPVVGGGLLVMAVACRVSTQCRRITAHARLVREANRITETRRRRLMGEESDVDIVPSSTTSGPSS